MTAPSTVLLMPPVGPDRLVPAVLSTAAIALVTGPEVGGGVEGSGRDGTMPPGGIGVGRMPVGGGVMPPGGIGRIGTGGDGRMPPGGMGRVGTGGDGRMPPGGMGSGKAPTGGGVIPTGGSGPDGLEAAEPEAEVAPNPVGAVGVVAITSLAVPGAAAALAGPVPRTGSFTTAACAAPSAAPAAAGAAFESR
jgi:hypothetical protein